eukprot:479276_1
MDRQLVIFILTFVSGFMAFINFTLHVYHRCHRSPWHYLYTYTTSAMVLGFCNIFYLIFNISIHNNIHKQVYTEFADRNIFSYFPFGLLVAFTIVWFYHVSALNQWLLLIYSRIYVYHDGVLRLLEWRNIIDPNIKGHWFWSFIDSNIDKLSNRHWISTRFGLFWMLLVVLIMIFGWLMLPPIFVNPSWLVFIVIPLIVMTNCCCCKISGNLVKYQFFTSVTFLCISIVAALYPIWIGKLTFYYLSFNYFSGICGVNVMFILFILEFHIKGKKYTKTLINDTDLLDAPYNIQYDTDLLDAPLIKHYQTERLQKRHNFSQFSAEKIHQLQNILMREKSFETFIKFLSVKESINDLLAIIEFVQLQHFILPRNQLNSTSEDMLATSIIFYHGIVKSNIVYNNQQFNFIGNKIEKLFQKYIDNNAMYKVKLTDNVRRQLQQERKSGANRELLNKITKELIGKLCVHELSSFVEKEPIEPKVYLESCRQHIIVPVTVKCRRDSEYDGKIIITGPYNNKFAYTVDRLLNDIIKYYNKHYSLSFILTEIKASSFMNIDIRYDDDCKISPPNITDYDKDLIEQFGLKLEIDLSIYHHSILGQRMCDMLNDNNSPCSIYDQMSTTDNITAKHLDHFYEFMHDKKECQFGDKCEIFKRLEQGSNNLNDRAHILMFMHPPRDRQSDVKNESNSSWFCLNEKWQENIALYHPSERDMKEANCDMENGFLKFLVAEVVHNGYKHDLGSNDEEKYNNYPIMQVVDEKLKCLRHKKMGSPLNKAEMLALLLYTGGDVNYDLCRSQRNGNYSRWIWFDYCLYFAVSKLSKREYGSHK